MQNQSYFDFACLFLGFLHVTAIKIFTEVTPAGSFCGIRWAKYPLFW